MRDHGLSTRGEGRGTWEKRRGLTVTVEQGEVPYTRGPKDVVEPRDTRHSQDHESYRFSFSSGKGGTSEDRSRL